ncbi:hypothetical protein GGR51DRAFT_544354 [Nemania sp. FL0031]|nr:hypothetical protein GGR51DRAFT_544354 [Nemania sp. FL0031]
MIATPLPALPSTWTPPSSCLASTAYYMAVTWSEAGSYEFINMFGNPTPTEYGTPSGPPCLPTSFTAEVPYLTDGPCPSGYSVACATQTSYNNEQASILTCCPSGAYAFSCYNNYAYGCGYCPPHTSDVTWTGWLTDLCLKTPTGRPGTHAPTEGEVMWAWGVRMLSTTASTISTPTSSSTASSSTMSTATTSPTASTTAPLTNTVATPTSTSAAKHEYAPSSSAGLNPTAKVGIGVGAAVSTLLLVNIVLLLRRGRQKRAVQKTSALPESAIMAVYSEVQPPYKPCTEPGELYAENPHVLGLHPIELQGS